MMKLFRLEVIILFISISNFLQAQQFKQVSIGPITSSNVLSGGCSWADFNNDGNMDVFVANDFFHPDYLYINNKNGTFSDQALNRTHYIGQG